MPHARGRSRLASLSSLPQGGPQRAGHLSPLLSLPTQSSRQMLGAPHSPYGSYGPTVAIPPGYMLVPAPGAMQVSSFGCNWSPLEGICQKPQIQ